MYTTESMCSRRIRDVTPEFQEIETIFAFVIALRSTLESVQLST